MRGLCPTTASTKWLARLGAVNDDNDFEDCTSRLWQEPVTRLMHVAVGMSGVRVGNDTAHTCVYGVLIVIYIYDRYTVLPPSY